MPADPVQVEADEIHQLLACAIVGAQWVPRTGFRRGHNVGAVLVDPDGEPVWWGLNAVFAEDNPLEHAEARLLRTYLAHLQRGRSSPRLTGYTVYATLEPCAMCAGAMIMADVDRVVYGQRDLRWGGAAERLALDSRGIAHGLAPYPRLLASVPSPSPLRSRLEQEYRVSGEDSVARWLENDKAREIFEEAIRDLSRFQVSHGENAATLRRAQDFFQDAVKPSR